ncbi:hypothetical protein NicSoilB4_20820 [Arthrobacter sp. NicSoilB4]|nr:hypothetical protein NicSoilB4_20820 [Arthrobacter sp. NicSoilB4]
MDRKQMPDVVPGPRQVITGADPSPRPLAWGVADPFLTPGLMSEVPDSVFSWTAIRGPTRLRQQLAR